MTGKKGTSKAAAAPLKASPPPATTVEPARASSPAKATARQQRLHFRTENLKSSYCNMANVTSTREEVVLNFGVNQNWDQPADPTRELEVDIQHRVILSPFAARRLSDALAQLMRDYEQRYGKLA